MWRIRHSEGIYKLYDDVAVSTSFRLPILAGHVVSIVGFLIPGK
jgi:hypothetical protein